MTANTHVCILQYPLPQNTKVFEVETVSLVTGSRGERWRHLRGKKKKITRFLHFIPFPPASTPTANPVWKYFQGKEDYVVVCYEF